MGRRMKQEDLYKFFKDMQEPLGMANTNPKQIIRNIIKMDIESDPSGLVYFNVLLFKAMRRVYGMQGGPSLPNSSSTTKGPLTSDSSCSTTQR